MKKYERYVIYPVLLICLFYTLTGFYNVTTAQNIPEKLIVKGISITNENGQEIVYIGKSKNTGGMGGMIEIYNVDGLKAMTAGSIPTSAGGFLVTYSQTETMGTYMGTINSGKISTYNSKGNYSVRIGQTDIGNGLINIYDKDGDKWTSYGFRH